MERYLNIIAFNIPWPANYGGIIDVYYKLIYNVLKDYFLKIWIVNTYCIKNVSCHKTEKKQKELICQLRTYLTVSVLSLCH